MRLLAPTILSLLSFAGEASAEIVDSNAALPTLPRMSVGDDASVAVGAVLQTGFAYRAKTSYAGTQEGSGFEIGQARLLGRGRQSVTADIEGGVVFEGNVAEGTLGVLDLYGSVDFGHGALIVDAGQMKVPMSLANLTPEAQLQFVAPAAGLRDLGYGRDRGLRLRSNLDFGGAHLAAWAAVQNGSGIAPTGGADDHLLFSGRAELGPLGPLSLDEPDLGESPFRVVVGSGASYTDHQTRVGGATTTADLGAQEFRLTGDVRMRALGLSFRGETLHAWARRTNGTRVERSAFVMQAGYAFPVGGSVLLEPALRLEQHDRSDAEGAAGFTDTPANLWNPAFAEQRQYEVGLNAYVREHRMKIMASYRRVVFLEGAKDSSGAAQSPVGDSVLALAQFGWF